MLEVGTMAPGFKLQDQNGTEHSLSDYAGQKVILYFYPKDMTSGCTKQACGFAERYPLFREKGAVILGVSKDSVASHKKFKEKYGLPFTLLSDPDKEVNAFDEDVQRSLQVGMDAHLSKPVDPEHLYQTLEELIWEYDMKK